MMFPPWTTVFAFFFGAAFGSFVNVLVWRMPRGESIVNPPSHCPKCDARLVLPDLIPLLSFLVLGARCRHCKQPVPWRYFWVELLCGSLWAALWWQYLITRWEIPIFVSYAAFATVLVAIFFIDVEHLIIPDELNTALLIIGIALGAYWLAGNDARGWANVGSMRIPAFVVGGVAGVVIFWFIALAGRLVFRKDALGHGDIKMARGIGALLPFGMMVAGFALSIVFGALIGGAAILWLRLAGKDSDEAEEEFELAPSVNAEPPALVLVAGLQYLLCLDVIALMIPPLAKPMDNVLVRMVRSMAPGWNPPEEEVEDTFTPTLTTIPFGPFLALGTAAAMLFSGPIQSGINAYLTWATGGG